MMPGAAPRATAASAARPRLRALFELGKLRIVELWLGFFAGVSLLDRSALTSPRVVALLALILVAGVAVIGATCALDDVTGVRDGVDQANHRAGARWGVRKPILQGEVTEDGALGFVRVLLVVGGAAYAGALALAWPLPGWLVSVMTAMMLLALSYSYGPKLSYRGAGELVIAVGGAGTVLVPYALVARAVTPALLVEAALVGAWHAQVVVFSNSHDADGDRATGRLTLAARLSPRANKLYIAALFVAVWAFAGAALATSLLPRAHALALAPVAALQLRQLLLGVWRDRWLDARLVGFRVLRVGIAGLTLLNLVAPR